MWGRVFGCNGLRVEWGVAGDSPGLRDRACTGENRTPEGVNYRVARRVAGEALSPKVWLRWAKRSMLPGPKMKVPPS